MHVHLDPIGGVAGDMFVAAMVDAWPSLADVVDDALARVEGAAAIPAAIVDHHDGTLMGRRFVVRAPESDHGHRGFAALRADLERSDLDEPVRTRAIDIFAHLAEAEGRVHGVDPADVEFHEVGAWDSVADIVAAAAVIESCGATSWSVGPLPMGGGTVETGHGTLPVPAPATMLLLEGFVFVDDGLPGERVTPTGAAILRSLEPWSTRPPAPHRLDAVGAGFGSRTLPGRPNILRVMALTPTATGAPDTVGVVELDVDDQTAEDLAIGLDRLRAAPGVLDVIQRVAYGKKSRLVTEVRVLCEVAAVDDVVERCFRETTTLGVRWAVRSRVVLERAEMSGPSGVRVKSAVRPDGRTSVKAEMDELADAGDRLTREERRRRAETATPETSG